MGIERKEKNFNISDYNIKAKYISGLRRNESNISKIDDASYYLKYFRDIEKFENSNFKNDLYKDIRRYEKKDLVVKPVPQLEVSADKHRFEQEEDVACVRQTVLPLSEYFSQIGPTCGLTSFRLILGALGKEVPSVEDVAGSSSGNSSQVQKRFLDRTRDFSDIKVTRVKIHGVKEHQNIIREEFFSLLGEGQYLYVPINWMKLHGRWHPEGRKDNDHAIVVHGARETAAPIEGAKINFLITDPNSVRYHNIWIPENLLYQAFANEYADISAYKCEAPTIKERVKKNLPVKGLLVGEMLFRPLQIKILVKGILMLFS